MQILNTKTAKFGNVAKCAGATKNLRITALDRRRRSTFKIVVAKKIVLVQFAFLNDLHSFSG